MGKQVVLKERPRTMTPSDILDAINEKEVALDRIREMLMPLNDVSTFTAMLKEVQEGRAGQTATLQEVQKALAVLAKAMTDTNTTNARVSDGLARSMPGMVEAIGAKVGEVVSANEKSNAAIARAIGKLAAALAKEARPMPAIEAEVTERDLTDRVKKFVMREV